jgi:hypothetical protein
MTVLALAQRAVDLAGCGMLRSLPMPRLLLAVILVAVLAGCGALPRAPVPQPTYPIIGGGGGGK